MEDFSDLLLDAGPGLKDSEPLVPAPFNPRDAPFSARSTPIAGRELADDIGLL
jgi:hypothetical protein